MRNLFFVLIVCIICSFSTLNANSILLDPPVLVEVISKDFPLFKDSDDKIIYIDFELLTTNVKALRMLDKNDHVSFQDDVTGKKVDAIYEFDYSNYTPGTYKLQLLAYSGEVLNAHLEIR